MLDLKNIPKSPGIYQYFNKTGDIIYIWKSVNLFSRVNSYFNGTSKLNFAKQKMVKQIHDIKTIVVENETESLILETNLIKKHLPKYNILMKDGKNHLYIKITQSDYPKLTKTRIKTKSGSYYGPYISGFHVNNILQFIKKYFGYGYAWEHFFHDGKWYNLDKYLFQWHQQSHKNIITDIGDSNSELSIQQAKKQWYNKQIEKIKEFLKWNFKNIISELEIEMKAFAQELRFEEAQKIKQTIESISSLEISQNMRDSVAWDYNVIHYLEKFDNIFVWVIKLRDGKIIDFHNFEIKNNLQEDKNHIIISVIESLIAQENTEIDNMSKVWYLLPHELDLPHYLESLRVEIPQIGSKHDLLKMCYKNIYEYAYKAHLASLSTKWFSKKNQLNLLSLLGYSPINKDILFECNDISHISWNHTVASRSIIENGKSNTSKYKKFRIKTLDSQKIDDFWSMKEIMKRRLLEIEKSWYIPDLIIIDGWKWQLGSVMKIIEDYLQSPVLWENNSKNGRELIKKLQLVSLAKREEELFLPWESESIILKKDSLELRMVQKIRDEAHRFAITFNRDSRNKAMKKNILESLPGFWPVTRKKILKKWWSVEALREFPDTELLTIINTNQLDTLRDHWLIN